MKTAPLRPIGTIHEGVERGLAIEAQGLTKRYGVTAVVEDLTFTARPGVITGFLGPNGAGKSTTLRMLLGLTAPSGGSITIGGRRLVDLSDPARAVGALLDARSVHPRRSAAQHLLAYAQTAGLGRERVAEVLALVGLTGAANRPAGEFSLGMGQRLGIATALLGDPPVLVFDEPLNGLDPEGIRWIRTLLRDLAREGRTILFSSHLMSEMELTADDLIVIGQGRLIAESSLDDFVSARTAQAVAVRTPERARLADALRQAGAGVELTPRAGLQVTGMESASIGRLAADERITLHELTPLRESLEDVFLRITQDVTDHGSRA
ncbi:ATP-binding cassette domain-containing protein [Nocardioides sp. LHD-245]|uniref:ABC transporter ATP-binding protein n=1 Tax=Nocardioides sp. LHD-245 TaxID=3051387 RepID=UPI0027DFAC8C|nr:ATP-binding cassette domain-containing protein [Nocardioides sp. LHD-245]